MRPLFVACVGAVAAVVVVSVAGAALRSAPTGRWELRTFSFPKLYEDAQPTFLNERGVIVGQARTDTVILKSGHWYAIKPPPGMRITRPVGVNDRGRVIAQLCSGADYCDGSRTARSVVWHDGRLSDLGTLGGRSTRVWDINNKGEIVGASDTPAQHVRAVLWRKGKLIKLGTLGGKHSGALGINERSEVIGWSETRGRRASPHLFLWANGKMTDLGITAGRAWSVATLPFINERGHIAGHMPGCGTACGFFWRDDTLSALNGLEPLGLNNRDEIPVRAASGQLVVWQDGKHARLGRSDLQVNRSRSIINDAGQIIGMDWARMRGLVWKDGKYTYLPRYVPDPHKPDETYSQVVAINNHGQILGTGAWGKVLLWAWRPAN